MLPSQVDCGPELSPWLVSESYRWEVRFVDAISRLKSAWLVGRLPCAAVALLAITPARLKWYCSCRSKAGPLVVSFLALGLAHMLEGSLVTVKLPEKPKIHAD